MTYYTRDTCIKKYLIFPKPLMGMKLPATAMLLYIILLDRCSLSKRSNWVDEAGHVYINYTIQHLQEALGKKESSVKNALQQLEIAGLIERVHQGVGRPNRIYVLLPEDGNAAARAPENCPPDSQNSGSPAAKIPATIHTDDTHPDVPNHSEKLALGRHNNVNLTRAEYEDLTADVPNIDGYIELFSEYIYTNGDRYRDHASTIRMWYQRDRLKNADPPKKVSGVQPSGELGKSEQEAIQMILENKLEDTYIGDDIAPWELEIMQSPENKMNHRR